MKTTEVNASITSGNVPLSAGEQHKKALDLSQQVIKKMIEQFPVLAEKESDLIRQAELFLHETVAIKYLFNPDGTPAILDGTPRVVAPSAEIEFQKTMGSRLALWALNAGVNIFNSATGAANSPEEKLRTLFKAVTEHFADGVNNSNDAVMTDVLAIHDIMKSEKIREAVNSHFGNIPAEIRGIIYSKETFRHLDHDTQLLIALHFMKEEITAGTDSDPQSLTAIFFSNEKITPGRNKALVPLMEMMWGMRLNSLQALQGEIHSAQLIPFLKQVVNVNDADYLQLKLALKAFCLHEVTDLMGAANPAISVLSEPVVTPLLDMFDRLTDYADGLRQESRTAEVDINKKADDFYRILLPELTAVTAEKLTLIPGDAEQTAMLVRRLGRMCRMGGNDVALVVSALDNLARHDERAYAALLDMYGRPDRKIYLYYGPALLENFAIRPPWSEKSLPQLTRALHTLGRAAQQSALEIVRAGGEQAFSQKYGSDFINIRPLCISVWESLNTDDAEKFDPAQLKFRIDDNSLHNDIGMKGPAPTILPDSLRTVYKVSLPDLHAELSAAKISPTGHYYVRGRYYIRTGEDYYWVRRHTTGAWAMFSQTDRDANPIPVVYKNNEWQLPLVTNGIDETFADFSTHQQFRDWFHRVINTFSLLGSRYANGAEQTVITASQKQSLITFILKYFQLQATYSLENTATSVRHPASPLVADLAYSRLKPSLLYELLCHIRTNELKSRISAAEQIAFGQKFYKPVEQEFHIIATSMPLLIDEKQGMPPVFDDATPALYGERMVYIKSLGLQLVRKTDFPSKEGLHKVLSQKGLRMSPNEAAEILSQKMAQWLEAGSADKVRQVMADFLQEKYGAAIADSFRKVELSPNGLLAQTAFDPLGETGARELQALQKLYRQCLDVDKNQLPFYVTQNIEFLQSLIGSDPAVFFTRQTPAMITAEFTDRLQATYDLMVKINNEQGMMAPSLISSRMEQFYHTLQNMHHLIRFQMSWNGVQVDLNDTLKQLLPDTVRQSAHVICAPHGISVIRQIRDALPADFHQHSALLKGLYYETPDLFPQAKKVDSVTDPALKNKKLIILEPHANNMSVNHIAWHDAIALLRNVFDGTSSMPRTLVLDVTANHLTEVEIQNIIAAAKPYIDRGDLNLVLVQSAVKFFQNGMDLASAGTGIALNNNQFHWSGFNDVLRRTQLSVPAEDRTWLASMLRLENMPLQQKYLDKIRSNTRLLRSLLDAELQFGHHNDNVFQLTVNTDPDTFYLTFQPTDDFVALHTGKTLADISDLDRMTIGHFAFKSLFYDVFKGLVNTERSGFGFNVSNLAPSLTAVRFTPGIEDALLVQEYARRILNRGRELYDKGVIPYYLPEVNRHLGKDVNPAEVWAVDYADLQWHGDQIKKKLNGFNPGQPINESRWIIKLQSDEASSDAVLAKLQERPENSEIIACYQDQQKIDISLKWDSRRASLTYGAISPPAEALKLIIVGHSLDKEGNQLFGGRSLARLQDDFRIIFKKIPYGRVTRLDIELVGSKLVNIHSRETSLPAELAKTLLDESQKLGINPENISLRASPYHMMVMPDGENHVYIHGRGWTLEKTLAADKKHPFVWRYNSATQEMATSFTPPGSLGSRPEGEKWTWTPADLQKLTTEIREKLKTLPGQDADESRRVMLLQPNDKTVREAAWSLFAKHPRNSALILWGQDVAPDILQCDSLTWDGRIQSVVQGPAPSLEGKKLKLIFVGHGPDADSDNNYFGGMSADEWEKNFTRMLAALPQDSVSDIHVTLTGCLLVDPNDHEVGLPGRLADILLKESRRLGIDPERLKLTASEYYVKVRHQDGKKAFWLSDEKKWATKEELIKKGVSQKSTWGYDSRTQSMVSELQYDRVRLMVRFLWSGMPFHEFSYVDQQSVLRILTPAQIDQLSQRSDSGRLLFRTLIDMLQKSAIDGQQASGTTDGRELPGITDGHGALATGLDTEGKNLVDLAQKVGINPNDSAENDRVGRHVFDIMQRQDERAEMTVDSHTRQRVGLRARVLYALQMTSNGVLTLGAAAALCRLYAIKKRLDNKTLSQEERTALLTEERLVTAELSVDLTQEVSEFINSKFGMRLTRLPAGSASTSPSAALNLGTRITQGLRAFGLSVTASVLTAVGTAFAWYGVITAAKELQKLSSSAAATRTELQSKITQLRVNLGVNIMTALVSTVLTVGTAVSLIAGIALSLNIAGAAGVAVVAGTFMSVAGPVGGLILVAAFVGLWIYNGIKTVEEFSRHMQLNGWERLQLGAGSIFGYVPDQLQIKYDAEKLRPAVEKAAQLEKSGLLESLPEVKTLYQFLPEIVPGEIKHREQYIDTVNAMPTWSPPEVTPPTMYHSVIDINPDDNWYLAVFSDGSRRQLRPDEFTCERSSREVVTTDKAYQYGAFLTLLGKRVELPNSVWGQNNHSLDSSAVSGKLTDVIPPVLKTLLDSEVSARLYAADEAGYLTLFCIHEQDKKLSFFKYRKTTQGRYELDVWYTQALPEGLSLQNTAAVLFHDIDGKGLAALVVVNADGSLQVARQLRNGSFVLTKEFSLWRATGEEDLSFPWYDSVQGFGGTSRILYSHSSGGTRYAHVVISKAEQNNRISLVNLNRGTGAADGQFDNFIASSKQDADLIFYLGGGREKRVSGGGRNNSFYLFDDKTLCKLKGGSHTDTLNFSRLNQETVQGVRVDARTKVGDWDGQASLKLKTGASVVRVFFSGMENFIGTPWDDVLIGDGGNNDIDGVDGEDNIDAGAGNDVISGVRGKFTGGPGIDRYRLRRMPAGSNATVELIEDYRDGADSHVILDYHIDEITGITPEEGKHLLITLRDGGRYRLRDFYANSHAGADRKTSSFVFTTKDGFSFQLKTAASPPSAVTDIPVSFQGSAESQSWQVYLNAGRKRSSVWIHETVAGQYVQRKILLPAPFVLELQPIAASSFVQMTGQNRAERLTGKAGSRMTGNGGADTYFIEDSAGGTVEINNEDTSSVPAVDTLILPWALASTALSVHGNDVRLSHAGEPDRHVQVNLFWFMNGIRFRHLALREPFGPAYRLDVTDGKVHLASGPLIMDREDRLELLSASEGWLTLDGRSRSLSGGETTSTVIIDHSGRGNSLAGTQTVHNYLQVSGGRNSLYGGRLADTLNGGAGYDYMAGGDGDDAYYISVNGSATLDDTGGNDVLVLTGIVGTAEEALLLDRAENSLRIRFKNSASKEVIVNDYFNASRPDKKIEYLVMDNLSYRIDNLVDAMVSMSVPGGSVVQKQDTLIGRLNASSPLITLTA